MKNRLLITLSLALVTAGCVTENSNPTSQLLNNTPDYHEAARINTQLGSSYANNGIYQEALIKLRLATQQDPDFAPAHGALAYVYSALGQVAPARQEYEKALSLTPENGDIRNNYGVFLCSHDDLPNAESQFNAVLRNPSYGTPAIVYTNLAICYSHQAKFKFAEAAVNKALSISPDFANGWVTYADLKYLQKKYSEALEGVDKATALGVKDPHLLLIGVKSAKGANNIELANQFQGALLNQFPNSQEAQSVGHN